MFKELKEELLKIIYHYYPISLRCGTEEYNHSLEFKRLKKRILSAESKEGYLNKLKEFLNILSTQNENMSVQNFTLLRSLDRCYNIQLVKDLFNEGKSHSICLNLSVLIPYYTIHVLEIKRSEDYKNHIDIPRRQMTLETGEYKHIIEVIKKYLNEQIGLEEFPESLLNEVIPDINFQNSNIGQFTFYNAFFMDEYYTR